MNTLKKCLPDAIVVALFAVISFAYFLVPVSQGKILFRHDSQASVGLGQELTEYEQRTGEVTRWTNSLFSGMPTYQISPAYSSTDGLSTAMSAYHLWLPDYVWFLFAYLLGFYILLRAFNFRQSLAALGSILWAFSSYFLIIIAAGHLWKVMALAYLPPMIAGVVLAYRGKYLWGFIVTAVFTAFEVKANHVQMTYYYLFIVLFMVVAYLVQAIREKRLQHFLKASGVLVAAALIGIAINISNLYHTWEYQKESMRGKSELTKANSANHDAACARCQGWRKCSVESERNSNGKSQSRSAKYAATTLRSSTAIFRNATGYERSCLCGSLRSLPLCAGLVHR